jgi:hypothetical protein
MGFFRRLIAGQAAPSTFPPLTLLVGDVEIPAVDFTTHGGDSDSYSRGYALIGPQGGEYGHLSELLSSAWMTTGLEVLYVVGVTKRPHALASEAFAPGKAVRLMAEPQNRYDRNAVGVWDAAGQEQLGYLPREYAATIAKVWQDYRAIVLREAIDKATGRRVGVKLVLAPLLTATASEGAR